MIRVEIKPLGVNAAYRGRRFSTSEHKEFKKACGYLLPKKLPFDPKGKLAVSFIFGFSTAASDVDGPIKTALDCLQKRYGFNDNQVYSLKAEKDMVKKGQEYWAFEIQNYKPTQ